MNKIKQYDKARVTLPSGEEIVGFVHVEDFRELIDTVNQLVEEIEELKKNE